MRKRLLGFAIVVVLLMSTVMPVMAEGVERSDSDGIRQFHGISVYGADYVGGNIYTVNIYDHFYVTALTDQPITGPYVVRWHISMPSAGIDYYTSCDYNAAVGGYQIDYTNGIVGDTTFTINLFNYEDTYFVPVDSVIIRVVGDPNAPDTTRAPWEDELCAAAGFKSFEGPSSVCVEDTIRLSARMNNLSSTPYHPFVTVWIDGDYYTTLNTETYSDIYSGYIWDFHIPRTGTYFFALTVTDNVNALNMGIDITFTVYGPASPLPPTQYPTTQPTVAPTSQPTAIPTTRPTPTPTTKPTVTSTPQPTITPTTQPTVVPTTQPTAIPTSQPSQPSVEEIVNGTWDAVLRVLGHLPRYTFETDSTATWLTLSLASTQGSGTYFPYRADGTPISKEEMAYTYITPGQHAAYYNRKTGHFETLYDIVPLADTTPTPVITPSPEPSPDVIPTVKPSDKDLNRLEGCIAGSGSFHTGYECSYIWLTNGAFPSKYRVFARIIDNDVSLGEAAELEYDADLGGYVQTCTFPHAGDYQLMLHICDKDGHQLVLEDESFWLYQNGTTIDDAPKAVAKPQIESLFSDIQPIGVSSFIVVVLNGYLPTDYSWEFNIDDAIIRRDVMEGTESDPRLVAIFDPESSGQKNYSVVIKDSKGKIVDSSIGTFYVKKSADEPDPVPSETVVPAPVESVTPAPTETPEPTLTFKPESSFVFAEVEDIDGTLEKVFQGDLSTGGLTVQELIDELDVPDGVIITVRRLEGFEQLEPNDHIATGLYIWIQTPENFVYEMAKIVIKGDVLGTGQINIAQLTRLATALNGSKPLEPQYLAALPSGGKTPSITDLVALAKMLTAK